MTVHPMQTVSACRTFALLAVVPLLQACNDPCPDSLDMEDGIRLTSVKPRERFTFRRLDDGTILQTRIAVPRPAEQPKMRVLRAGILPVQDRFENGAVIDNVIDVGPAFPPLPLPPGRYTFLGHTSKPDIPTGFFMELLSWDAFFPVNVGRCTYPAQIITFTGGQTQVVDAQKRSNHSVGRVYVSPELGIPLRWEFYEDDTFQKLLRYESFSLIERLRDVDDQ